MKIRTHTTWKLEVDDYEVNMIVTALGLLARSIEEGDSTTGYELEAVDSARAALDSRR